MPLTSPLAAGSLLPSGCQIEKALGTIVGRRGQAESKLVQMGDLHLKTSPGLLRLCGSIHVNVIIFHGGGRETVNPHAARRAQLPLAIPSYPRVLQRLLEGQPALKGCRNLPYTESDHWAILLRAVYAGWQRLSGVWGRKLSKSCLEILGLKPRTFCMQRRCSNH